MNYEIQIEHIKDKLEEIGLKYSIEGEETPYFLIRFKNDEFDYTFELNILFLQSVNALTFIVTDMLTYETNIPKEQLLNEINSQNSSLVLGKITFSEGNNYIYGVYECTLNLIRDHELISIEELKSTISYIVSYKRQLESAKRLQSNT